MFKTVLCWLGLFLATRLPMHGQANVVGQWSGVQQWPSANPSGWVPTHGMLLPTGKVLAIYSYDEGPKPRIWDPATNSVTTASLSGYNQFCAGHSFLTDGRLFVTGGHVVTYVGVANAAIYNPFTNAWQRVANMNAARWYPTNTTLPNGDVLVISGNLNGKLSFNDLPQVFQVATGTWRSLTTAQLHLQTYPFMFLAPNGRVFDAGWDPTSRYLNTSGTGSWSVVAASNFGWRNYGSAVMYEPGKILLIGGGGDVVPNLPTATVEAIDLNAANPAWLFKAPMHFRRRQHNTTILPDGQVFVSGGSSGSGFNNAASPVLATEMWNPATNTWTTMASITRFRGYHSFALLLPDGRVLSAGGQDGGGANAEVFSPPYLFKGTRPTISSAPSSVSYGQTALIGTPNATSITNVTWIRLSAVTHSFNQEQRFMRLNFTQATGGLNVTFPSNPNVSPPGYYMLFILNGTGVPSVARIIRIRQASSGTGTIAGKVTDISNGLALSGATVSYSGGSTTTDSAGNYRLSNVVAGTYNVTAAHVGYLSRTLSASVTSGATMTLNIPLATAGKIAGRVLTISGTAISGVTVTIKGGVIATTVIRTTDSLGNYNSSWIPVGTNYSVTVSKTVFTTQTRTPLTVTAGATTTVNFTMQ